MESHYRLQGREREGRREPEREKEGGRKRGGGGRRRRRRRGGRGYKTTN
jgi:hypothetical protein